MARNVPSNGPPDMRRHEWASGRVSLLADILQGIAERGWSFVRPRGAGLAQINGDLVELLETLLAGRGEASGLALAQEILDRWQSADSAGRLKFLTILGQGFGPDEKRLDAAIEGYLAERSQESAARVHAAAEPRRQELIRRINRVESAMHVLVNMRMELLGALKNHPELKPVDTDFVHLFSSWFNRGFLVLRRIDWSTSASILEKIIRYEAVHAISSWEDLRRRLAPGDRRCFAFFHPRLPEEPLIFVEVALMPEMPAAIDEVLVKESESASPLDATTAVFYSISNCQKGLRGISFGNFLLKQVIEELRRELPEIRNYVTLSPAPRFAAWLAEGDAGPGDSDGSEIGKLLAARDWPNDETAVKTLAAALPPLAARYFAHARDEHGLPIDPVARFHLGNGARLERINFLGDRSAKGLAEGHGLMVNYLYKVEDVERNHELYASRGEVAMSKSVRRLLSESTRPPPASARWDGPPAGSSLPEDSAA